MRANAEFMNDDAFLEAADKTERLRQEVARSEQAIDEDKKLCDGYKTAILNLESDLEELSALQAYQVKLEQKQRDYEYSEQRWRGLKEKSDTEEETCKRLSAQCDASAGEAEKITGQTKQLELQLEQLKQTGDTRRFEEIERRLNTSVAEAEALGQQAVAVLRQADLYDEDSIRASIKLVREIQEIISQITGNIRTER